MTAERLYGVIVKGIGGFYTVHADNGRVYTLRPRGAFRKQKLTPLVGDAISFVPDEAEGGWFDQILPRRNELIRPPVANLTFLVIVVAPMPKPDLILVDSLLADAWRHNIEPVLVINKCDLDIALCEQIHGEYRMAGVKAFITSATRNTGLDDLKALMLQGICCFAGQSGVGKSSLLTAITSVALGTGEISRRIERGKHTTRHVELILHQGFRVLDTAGFSLLEQAVPEEPVLLKAFYPEFAPYEPHCRFQPCYHRSEPGCAVLRAADEGKIPDARVARYHQLLEQAKEAWKSRYE